MDYAQLPSITATELPEPHARVECGVNGHSITIMGNSADSWSVWEGRSHVCDFVRDGDRYQEMTEGEQGEFRTDWRNIVVKSL